MAKVAVSIPDDLLDQIDSARINGQTRSGWIVGALTAALESEEPVKAAEAQARTPTPYRREVQSFLK